MQDLPQGFHFLQFFASTDGMIMLDATKNIASEVKRSFFMCQVD